ncbi:MAG: HAD-IC family P-type ATPase [Hominilimicola sp.]
MNKKNKIGQTSVLYEGERFNPNPEFGLSAEQVKQRIREGYINETSDSDCRTVGKIIRSNVFTYFNFIFFILAVVLLIERSYNNLTFLGVVIINTIIGIIQEVRSKRELEKLNVVSAPVTKVIRSGNKQSIKSSKLVLDDIVVFEAGNQICADAILCDGEITVNESLVTGEADEIKKTVGDELLSGSFVVSGSCRARLDKIGDDSFASKLTTDAKRIKKQQRPGMMKSLTVLIKIIGVIIIPFSIIMFINQNQKLGLPTKTSVENTVASVIGMIPEGLYLLTSIALAASTIRLARNKTLVHDMKCIETLARVDVICVDKTGTITEPEMKLKEIVSLKYPYDKELNVEEKIRQFALNMDNDNITMAALKTYFNNKSEVCPASAKKGFSSAEKYSAVKFNSDEAYVLGAPESLLKDEFGELKAVIEEHSLLGERVLLFAEYRYDEYSDADIFRYGSLNGKVIPVALITFINRIRPEAKETFEYFTNQGVSIKVISGDNPLTVSKIAQEAGIPKAEKYIDVSTLDESELSSNEIFEYTVFGRVSPEQKRILVKTLKKSGHTVGMTGDGVNDVLALKDADCGIAMASGSDAAANVADLVLLDSNFADMPSVVNEGRRVINNIERSASLFLVKNIFSFIMSLLAIFTVSVYPLKPAQMSLVSSVMIGIPSFFLALAPNHDIVKGKFLRNVLLRAFPSALTAVILVEYTVLFSKAFGIDVQQISTVACCIYATTAYIMLFRVCKPMNIWRGILFAAMGIAFITLVVIIPGWFNLVALDFGCVLILTVLILLAYPINRAIQAAFDFFCNLLGRPSKSTNR